MGVTRYLGFAEETTFGTAVAAVETIDPGSAELDPSGDQALIYEGVSRLDRIVAPAQYLSEGSIETPFDLESFPWFLKWAPGGYSVTGTGPYIHSFFPQDFALMKSFTARVGKDVFEHVFSGCVVSSLELELDDSFLTASIDVAGGKDSKATLQATPTFTQGEIYAPHQVTAEINGVDESAFIESFSIKIDTGADNESGVTIGSRFPRRAFRGAFEIEMELNLSFFSTAQLEKFWGTSTGPTSTTLLEFDTTIKVGTDVVIHIPRAVYTAMSQPLGGRDRIEQTATLRALVAENGSGPIAFTITNDKATY
jgi:hypothetical protein